MLERLEKVGKCQSYRGLYNCTVYFVSYGMVTDHLMPFSTVQCSIVSSATQLLFSLLSQSLQLCLIYPMSKLDADLLLRFLHSSLSIGL